jgi:hypothetical protein
MVNVFLSLTLPAEPDETKAEGKAETQPVEAVVETKVEHVLEPVQEILEPEPKQEPVTEKIKENIIEPEKPLAMNEEMLPYENGLKIKLASLLADVPSESKPKKSRKKASKVIIPEAEEKIVPIKPQKAAASSKARRKTIPETAKISGTSSLVINELRKDIFVISDIPEEQD